MTLAEIQTVNGLVAAYFRFLNKDKLTKAQVDAMNKIALALKVMGIEDEKIVEVEYMPNIA